MFAEIMVTTSKIQGVLKTFRDFENICIGEIGWLVDEIGWLVGWLVGWLANDLP